LAKDVSVNKRQLQAAATQEQLLAAARDVFEEKGYQATTVGAITDRAATAHGTF
jgi:AcrR family transcriptional regulator